MTIAEERFAVMKAYLEGEDIEWREVGRTNWHTANVKKDDLEFCWGLCDYRIAKPKPRVVWVNVYRMEDGTEDYGAVRDTKEAADKFGSFGPNKIKCVRFVEDVDV